MTDKISGSGQLGIELILTSGFRVLVTPLPPYYKDVIDEQIPLPEFPKRKIVLMAGDVVYLPYDPQDSDADESSEDHELYVRWKYIENIAVQITALREKARSNFLLANCVKILDGPISFDSEEWVGNVEAAFENYSVPDEYSRRMLIFLKTQVILSPDEFELIVGCAVSPEVTMQGIMRALQGFRDNIRQVKSSRHHSKIPERKDRS